METCDLQDEDAILIAEALKDTADRLRVLSLTGNGILVNHGVFLFIVMSYHHLIPHQLPHLNFLFETTWPLV